MEWWLALVVIFGGLCVLFLAGMQVAIAFMVISIIGMMLWWGGFSGMEQFVLSLKATLASFQLLPIVLFVLMGEVMFRSTIAQQMINALDNWLGRLPGRMGLLAISSGTVLATTTGSAIAAIAILGESLVPEMKKRGYSNEMSIGAIMGCGALAVMIPPSSLAIVEGAVARESISRLLIAIIMPGFALAAVYAIYIIVRCWLQPSLAPSYDVASVKLSKKLVDTGKYILPLGLIVFLVTGVILLGIASPSEAAATGTLGTFILTAAYRRLNWKLLKESFLVTAEVSIMVLFIIMAARIFSQILVFSGGSQGLVQLALKASLPPIGIIISMQVVLLLLGIFLSPITMMMIALPIFMPIVTGLGFDPTWFLVMFLLNAEAGGLTPPFGLEMFVMQGIAHVTFQETVKAALPFFGCQMLVLVLILIFPPLALWLPGLMQT